MIGFQGPLRLPSNFNAGVRTPRPNVTPISNMPLGPLVNPTSGVRSKAYVTPTIGRMRGPLTTPAVDTTPRPYVNPISNMELGPLHTYIGPNAKGWNDTDIGKFSSLIDKKERREIDDSGSRVIPEGFNAISMRDFEVPMSETLEHHELYRNYPELKDIKVGKLNNEFGIRGSYGDGKVRLNTHGVFESVDDINSTLLHELQHAIQEKEGFARGGSPMSFQREKDQAWARINFLNDELSKAAKELDRRDLTPEEKEYYQNIYDSAMSEKLQISPQVAQGDPGEMYMRLGGEIEARDVQARQNMPMEQRLQSQPYASQGIRLHDALVRYR